MSDQRDLFAAIDRRIALAFGNMQPLGVMRGTVVTVSADVYRLTAVLDGLAETTPNIAYGVDMAPQPGDDVLVLRRGDGLMFAIATLGREGRQRPSWMTAPAIPSSQGSFDPRWYFYNGTTGMAYTTSGTYVRQGDLVSCRVAVTFTTKGSSTGQLFMGGLPFPGVGDYPGGAHTSYWAGTAWDITGIVANGGWHVSWYTAGAPLLNSDLSDGSQLYADIIYTTS
jgi:hypothetical protein